MGLLLKLSWVYLLKYEKASSILFDEAFYRVCLYFDFKSIFYWLLFHFRFDLLNRFNRNICDSSNFGCSEIF